MCTLGLIYDGDGRKLDDNHTIWDCTNTVYTTILYRFDLIYCNFYIDKPYKFA